MYILLLLVIHWYTSLFFQTVYLHRYSSHNMFKLPFWLDRVFYFLTFLTQGASFLNPKVYAVMHLEHHKHSDTESDPHSPLFSKDVFRMMTKTYKHYLNILENIDSYNLKIKDWKSLDNFADSWITRIIFGFIYFQIYTQLVTETWQYIFLPIHFIIGPIQGAIVNWCGHKYGYRNFNLSDNSKNTLPIDFLLMGELYQNNHHQYPQNLNFKSKWYEIDFGYLLLLPVLVFIPTKK
jgi:stearoyl-CoA desaturase (delta-9 desaturase)